jgi:tetratricopeptide (TPR) repeat protein
MRVHRIPVLALALALTCAATRLHADLPAAAPPVAPNVAALIASTPGDSLVIPLRVLEVRLGSAPEAAEAAMTLGHLHLVRGEYRDAVGAFGRAAARLGPARKAEARYWVGVAWLGVGDAGQARAAFEEASRIESPRRVEALLGLAQAWDLARRPDRASEVLALALAEPLGEAGPAVLERYAALAEVSGRVSEAQEARERVIREYPRSIEAAAARRIRPVGGTAGGGTVAVVIGTFQDAGRARALAADAVRAGFADARVVTRGEGLAAMHVVWLGTWPDTKKAAAAGEQATRALGVAYEIARSR